MVCFPLCECHHQDLMEHRGVLVSFCRRTQHTINCLKRLTNIICIQRNSQKTFTYIMFFHKNEYLQYLDVMTSQLVKCFSVSKEKIRSPIKFVSIFCLQYFQLLENTFNSCIIANMNFFNISWNRRFTKINTHYLSINYLSIQLNYFWNDQTSG